MIPPSSDSSQRIVLVVPAFPKLSEKFIVTKFLGLLDRGWDVRVVCGKSDPREWRRFPELEAVPGLRQRVRVSWPHRPRLLAAALVLPALWIGFLRAPKTAFHYLKTGLPRFGWRIFKNFFLDLQLILLQPALIHFEFGSLAVGRMYLKDLLPTAVTVSFRGYDLNLVGLDVPNYYQDVWDNADACHFLGQDLWNKARARGCPPEKPHSLISPALELRNFLPHRQLSHPETIGTLERPARLVSVGRLVWKKGYEVGLQAMKLIKDSGIVFHWYIVGDGDHRDALYFARHQLGLESDVTFEGELPHAEVLQKLLSSDIFLHPSLSEGFCNAVLEAQAAGIPVVCTDAGSLPENISNGETGLIVLRRDPQALSEAVLYLIRHPAIRQAMGKAGIARVEQAFSLDSHMKAWGSFYQSVLELDNE